MRKTLVLLSALVVLSACEKESAAKDSSTDDPQLTTVTCGDAQGLAMRAGTATGRRTAPGQGDLAKIIATNRATYFAVLVNVAELKCKVTDMQADGALTLAFEAVRGAQSTASDYERAQRWGEAALYATQAAGHLIKAAAR